ncbi:MAG: MaoC family dehydratase N-terminal domain-containing protein [Pseudorhodoplanes sp.]|nr:MaoC family dehydratase N-terminal domain-containing protein [Pseudorhodoplanes sp.]
MKSAMQGHVYPPYRLQPNRELARKFMAALGVDKDPVSVPPTYLIFLRGETLGVDLFRDLDIPREKALHGGQRYEWFAPLNFEDELDVTARIDKITEKQGKRGAVWFADITFEYRRANDGELVVREVTRLVKQS